MGHSIPSRNLERLGLCDSVFGGRKLGPIVYDQLVMERDNLQERCDKQEAEIRSHREQLVAEIYTLQEELKQQTDKYAAEIRILKNQNRVLQAEDGRTTPSTIEASNLEEYSPLPGIYENSPSQGYGPFVAERRLVYEPEDTPASPEVGAFEPSV